MNGELITDMVIPEGVTEISAFAFADYQYLRSVTIPEGVTYIGGKAFYNCANLSQLSLPASTTKIGAGAFQRCNTLTKLYFSGTKQQLMEIQVYEGNDALVNHQWQLSTKNALLAILPDILIPLILYGAVVCVCFILERWQQKRCFLRF